MLELKPTAEMPEQTFVFFTIDGKIIVQLTHLWIVEDVCNEPMFVIQPFCYLS